ncbi:dihydrodipicolinate reductase [Nakamurella sp. PAMC28650]|uniref:NAD(P)H-dependent amine dehydrogenase family protein n=1 Tax=Nakamurella sp. PAMC28650 TaxID=2762325 RepID=UPI00164EACAA|nr:dihydrodipicolinate reductase [Nakamurella sp. PAMC28650]QNK79684.1 dihydrodipicolinate reductase [Nakamurella sp. PAMC28650]
MTGRPWRVVQWATGAVGKTTLRAVIEHPDLELVGLYVHSERKRGLDAGEIARREPTGVIATDDIDDILALDADVVLHTARVGIPYESQDADIIALLESGKNVITTQGHHYPRAHGPERQALFADAARRGGVTLFGAGINPGFILERLTLTATGMCLRVDSISVREVVDAASMPDPGFVFGVMGMGRDVHDASMLTGEFAALYDKLFAEAIHYAADSLGVRIERIEPDHQLFAATRRLEIRAGVIEAGTVAGTNWRWHAIVDGARFLTLSVNWIMDPDLPGFEDPHLWTVSVRGVPGIEIAVDVTDPPVVDGRRTKAGQYATAGPVIGAIPFVCQAEPGIFELPTLMPWNPSLAGR